MASCHAEGLCDAPLDLVELIQGGADQSAKPFIRAHLVILQEDFQNGPCAVGANFSPSQPEDDLAPVDQV
jgi:hypothetical protein